MPSVAGASLKPFSAVSIPFRLNSLLNHDRMEFVEAVEALAALAGVEVPRERSGRDDRRERERAELYGFLERATEYSRRQLRAHPTAVDYLKGRGLSGEVARDFLVVGV